MPNCVTMSFSTTPSSEPETLTRFSSRRLKSKFVPLFTRLVETLGAPNSGFWAQSRVVLPSLCQIWLRCDAHVQAVCRETPSHSLGFNDSADRTCLEFADGSLANTYGIAFVLNGDLQGGFDFPILRFPYYGRSAVRCDLSMISCSNQRRSLSSRTFSSSQGRLDLSRTFTNSVSSKLLASEQGNKSYHGFYRRFLQV